MARGVRKIDKVSLGLLDSRRTDEDSGLLIQRDSKVTMLDIFGSEQKVAVAYFVSDLMGKGFNDKEILEAVKEKYELEWNLRILKNVKDLLFKMWRCDTAHTMNDQIAKELAAINIQLREAWEAWEFSKKGITHTKKHDAHSSGDADEVNYDLVETTIDEDTCAGDVKFQNLILELGKEKRKLLGLYAPEKKVDEGSKRPQAVQFNIVGNGAEGQASDLMKTIMGMNMPAFQQPAEPVQQAEVIETKKVEILVENDIDIDEMMNEMMM